jgi:FixJ family two-component response regulator
MMDGPLVHVLDDDDSFRASLLDLLSAGGFEARGYTSTGDFLINAPLDRPGCLLLDVRLPGPSGLDLQAALVRQGRSLPIIFLTGHADVATGIRAMKAGAVDFLEKPIDRAALFAAITSALGNGVDPPAPDEPRARLPERLDVLTAREREVLEHLVAGRLSKQIAFDLGVSLRTVKAHRAQIMEKLGVRTPAELGRVTGEMSDKG